MQSIIAHLLASHPRTPLHSSSLPSLEGTLHDFPLIPHPHKVAGASLHSAELNLNGSTTQSAKDARGGGSKDNRNNSLAVIITVIGLLIIAILVIVIVILAYLYCTIKRRSNSLTDNSALMDTEMQTQKDTDIEGKQEEVEMDIGNTSTPTSIHTHI